MALTWIGSLATVAALAVFGTANIVAAQFGHGVAMPVNLLLIAIAWLAVAMSVVAEIARRTSRITTDMTALSSAIAARLDEVGSRLDGMATQVDEVASRLDDLETPETIRSAEVYALPWSSSAPRSTGSRGVVPLPSRTSRWSATRRLAATDLDDAD